MVKSDISIIASSIRKHRGLRGLTQKQLADKVGVRFQHIYRWERGVKPTARYLAKLASALDVDVSELTTPQPVPDRQEKISHQTVNVIDSTETRQKRLIAGALEAILASDPRLRLMDVHLEEIVQCMRSLTEEIGEVKKSIAHLNNLFEKSLKHKKMK